MMSTGSILHSWALTKVLLCISVLSWQLHAFSTTKLLHSRYPTRSLHAAQDRSEQIFPEDDCLDLCDAWDTTVDNTPKVEVRRANTNTNYKLRRPRPSIRRWSDHQPTKCKTCSGNGDLICRFCEETGYLSSMGSSHDQVFYAGMGKDCPVCKDGMEVCRDCVGTGYVFTWLKEEA